MPCLNSRNTPRCWGKSKALRRLLRVGEMGRSAVGPVKRKGIVRGRPLLTERQKEERFWGNFAVSKYGCWEWKGCKVGKFKQARCRHAGEQIASRAAWVYTHGKIPNKLCVLHSCDNESCIRPDHLFLGTRMDNSNDKVKKGRQWRPIGELNPSAIITKPKVFEIRALRSLGLLQREISAVVGLSRSSVSNLLNGRSWTHLK